MKRILFIIIPIFGLLFILPACNKNSDQKFVSYKQYSPLKEGKYFIYQLDSIVPANFGSHFETRTHFIKDSVIELTHDLLNRPSYKIYRYIQKGATWTSINTFLITPDNGTLEYLEDNRRFIRLKDPISLNTKWKGNTYVTGPAYVTFNDFFNQWVFLYNDIGASKTVNDIVYPNTITVVQYDSTENMPFYKYGYNTYIKSYEVYADSIGLIYKDVLDWEYQPTYTVSGCKHIKPDVINGGFDTVAIDCMTKRCDSIIKVPNNRIIGCDTTLNSYYYNGYGIKQVLIQHN